MEKNVRSLLAILATTFGCIGLVLCAVSILGLWRITSVLERGSERVLAQADESLGSVLDRVLETSQRVRAAVVTLEDVKQRLEHWARREVVDRVAAGLDVEHTFEQFAIGVQHVDRGLELTQSSLQVVIQALELAAYAP